MTRMRNPSLTQDVTRMGGQNYKPSELRDVVGVLEETSYAAPMRLKEIVHAAGVDGRSIRQILRDLDARLMLIGKKQLAQGKGLFVCQYADEGEPYTRALDRHGRSEIERAERRRLYERSMPRRQFLMFDDDDLIDDDFDDDE